MWQINWFKVSIIILVSTALFILSATIYAYYKSSLIHFSGSINKDYFPAFGSFIGGILGILLSITSIVLIYKTFQSQQNQANQTQQLVDRQISLSIKPELVLEDFNSLYDNSKNTEENSFLGEFPAELRDINLALINIGLEAAQCISYRFEYNVIELKNYMEKNVNKPPFTFKYVNGKVFGELLPIDDDMQQIFGDQPININVRTGQELSYSSLLLPYKLEVSKIHILFPYTYLLFYFYTFLYMFKDRSKYESILHDYPQCLFHLHYQDLESRDYRKTFVMALDFKSAVGRLAPTEISKVQLEIIAMDRHRIRPTPSKG